MRHTLFAAFQSGALTSAPHESHAPHPPRTNAIVRRPRTVRRLLRHGRP